MAFIAPFIPAITAVASIAGSVYSGISQKKAADSQADAMREQAESQQSAASQAEALAYQNAANTEAETYESARRETRENDRAEAEMRAKAAASGIVAAEGTSTSLYMADEMQENQRQVEWMINAGISRADIERWQGTLAKDSGMASAQYTRDMADIKQKAGGAAMAGSLIGGMSSGLNAFQGQTSAWGLKPIGSTKRSTAHLTKELPAYGEWK